MAWEWVAPAGTAAVGVTSVVITFAASRSTQAREERAAARQRRYVVDDALRDERKDTYLRFLAALDAVDVQTPSAASATDAAVDEAVTTLTRLLDELQLVATPPVVQRAVALIAHAFEATAAAYGDHPTALVIDKDDLIVLIEAMAADLRREIPPIA